MTNIHIVALHELSKLEHHLHTIETRLRNTRSFDRTDA